MNPALLNNWWQAIRRWEVVQEGECLNAPLPRRRPAKRPMRALAGRVHGPRASVAQSFVVTPLGFVPEAALAERISASGSAALDRARCGRGPATLLQRGGLKPECEQAAAELAVFVAELSSLR